MTAYSPTPKSEVDTWLKATRGGLVAQPAALAHARSFDAAVVLLCVLVCAALVPLGATIMGVALSLHQIAVPSIASSVTSGTGVGLFFRQAYPGPPPLPGSVTGAFNLMSSWASNFSVEPLPEYRDYLVDRTNLARIGNMSAYAIKAERSVECSGRTLDLDYDGGASFSVATNMSEEGSWVRIRLQEKLTTWVDKVENIHENRSVSTVIFAVINGTIEGGETTDISSLTADLSDIGNFDEISEISAIACAIDVELVDSVLEIGNSATQRATLSTLSALYTPKNKKNPVDVATWLGVSTTVFGINIMGMQPMYVKGTNGFAFWTSTMYDYDANNLNWSLDSIKEFIDVSAGAVAMRIPSYYHTNTKVYSQYYELQFDHRRSYVLLAPVATILLMTIMLAWRNISMHRSMHVPVMRLATVGDILKSAQTSDVREAAEVDALDPTRPSKLDEMEVQYGVYSGDIVRLGNPVLVSRFER
ncbi:hypothetical protein N0V90_009736 [Kalmusia sp. IMI 367209]|nr:hypothetical protein N0V90_009736 [Kalmusia sp. IMI 367209]